VLIATGGTAGHIVPALSVADALRESGCEVEFLGGDRAEAQLVPAAGYKLHQIKASGLSRTSRIAAFKAALRTLPAVRSARRVVREFKPDVVLGGGGYMGGIGGIAGISKRIPVVLTEADSHMGLSNRILARFASRVCLAFPIEGRGSDRYVVTGRPVPAAAFDRTAARKRFGIANDSLCVLVTGGSLGARSINEAAVVAFKDADFEVLHLAGIRDLDSLTAPRDAYHLEGYVDRFGEAVLACDLAVARAGGSVFELAAHGCPALLIPYPYAAGDHQTGNARWMEQAGAARVISDADLTPELLARQVDEIVSDPARLKAMSAASAALARPNAARDVADQLIASAAVVRGQAD